MAQRGKTALLASDILASVPKVNIHHGDIGGGQLPAGRDEFRWVRTGEDNQARGLRQNAAAWTLAAIRDGGYVLDGKHAQLTRVQECVDGTRFFRARDVADVQAPHVALGGQLVKAPCDETTQCTQHPAGIAVDVAIERHRAGRRVAIVNAASAYHVGGAFQTGGRHALEEAINMQSTLHCSLQKARAEAKCEGFQPPPYIQPKVDRNRAPWEMHIPQDGVVISPFVEFFRGGTREGYRFLEQPVTIPTVISVALPNCNQRMSDAPYERPNSLQQYMTILDEKFQALLGAAVAAGADCLIMPDVGCGVYNNEPKEVGHGFGKALRTYFPRAFAEIHLVGTQEFAAAVESALSGAELHPGKDEHAPSSCVEQQPLTAFVAMQKLQKFDPPAEPTRREPIQEVSEVLNPPLALRTLRASPDSSPEPREKMHPHRIAEEKVSWWQVLQCC